MDKVGLLISIGSSNACQLAETIVFIFFLHCIAASALLIHLPRTFSYNKFLDYPTKYVIYYY